jgi:hypothetical protein
VNDIAPPFTLVLNSLLRSQLASRLGSSRLPGLIKPFCAVKVARNPKWFFQVIRRERFLQGELFVEICCFLGSPHPPYFRFIQTI